MPNSAYTKPLNCTQRQWIGLCFHWRMEKSLEVVENFKKLELEKDWVELKPKTCLLRQCQKLVFASLHFQWWFRFLKELLILLKTTLRAF